MQFPAFSYSKTRSLKQTEVTGLEKAMKVVKSSLEDLNILSEADHFPADKIRVKIQQLICSPVQGGLQSYRVSTIVFFFCETFFLENFFIFKGSPIISIEVPPRNIRS